MYFNLIDGILELEMLKLHKCINQHIMEVFIQLILINIHNTYYLREEMINKLACGILEIFQKDYIPFKDITNP